jgi:hypothetical protein
MRTVVVDGKEQVLSPRFQFDPGSYGGNGDYMPSIACQEQTAQNVWQYAYIVTKPSVRYQTEEKAVTEAKQDLAAAFQRKEASGRERVVGEYLSSIGYMSVTGFKVIDNDTKPGDTKLGWRG